MSVGIEFSCLLSTQWFATTSYNPSLSTTPIDVKNEYLFESCVLE